MPSFYNRLEPHPEIVLRKGLKISRTRVGYRHGGLRWLLRALRRVQMWSRRNYRGSLVEYSGTRGRLMYGGIGLVFALLLALYFVYQIRVVVLVFLLTLLFSIVISGPVDYLAR
jgi:hypothetical protein